MVYCVMPRELSPRLHAALERFYRHDPSIEVILERRGGERRRHDNRRVADWPCGPGQRPLASGAARYHGERRSVISHAAMRRFERRKVRNPHGRRVGERRAMLVPATAPALPSGARRHAERLAFLQRLVPPRERLEDLDTLRLLVRLQAGEHAVLGDVYQRYFDRVYTYLSAALEDPETAERRANAVFAELLKAAAEYDFGPPPFRAWLFGLVHGHAGFELDGELREVETDGRPARGPEVLQWLTDNDLLLLIDRVPRPSRQILMLRHMMGLSCAQVAEIVDCPADAVRRLEGRGFGFLEERLAAVGRRPRDRSRHGMSRLPAQTPVLRRRRLALIS